MELKPRWNERTALLGIPLIEPYGIETRDALAVNPDLAPLIEPYGIETILLNESVEPANIPLIEPYGIETIFRYR